MLLQKNIKEIKFPKAKRRRLSFVNIEVICLYGENNSPPRSMPNCESRANAVRSGRLASASSTE